MITTMAIACDIEVNDGETEERYEELKTACSPWRSLNAIACGRHYG